MDTPVLTPERIRIAVSSGVFTGGWREYPCLEEVDGAASGYLNYFSDTQQRLVGGILSWINVIPNGVEGNLHPYKLIPILKHNDIILEDSKDAIYMENAWVGIEVVATV